MSAAAQAQAASPVDDMPPALERHNITSLITVVAVIVVGMALTLGILPGTGRPLLTVAPVGLAYLLGQLGALIPVPGGIGGLDAGLVGALVLYGSPVAAATVGVIVYRSLLLVIPATLGGLAFVQLKRSLRDEAAARVPCADDVSELAAT